MEPPQNKQRLRILCLHSFRTSGAIFRQQLQRSGLLEELSDLVDLTFIDAPHPASGPIPRDVRPYFEGPYYEWFTAEAVGDRVEFAEAKMAASERFLVAQLAERGPFDGLMGFSQGAVMSAALVALQRSVLRPQLAALPPLRFCVLFAGMKSRHPGHVAAYHALSGKVPCPSLHVYGDKDALINPHCVELADAFQNSTVLLHQRGHVIPLLPPHQLAMMRAFLQSAGAAVTAAAAAPAAAAATAALTTVVAPAGLVALSGPDGPQPPQPLQRQLAAGWCSDLQCGKGGGVSRGSGRAGGGSGPRRDEMRAHGGDIARVADSKL